MGGPNPLAGVLIRRGKAGHVHKEDTGRMPGDEGGRDGVMHLHAKERQELPATTRSEQTPRKHLALESSGGVWPCQHIVFGLPASRTMRE